MSHSIDCIWCKNFQDGKCPYFEEEEAGYLLRGLTDFEAYDKAGKTAPNNCPGFQEDEDYEKI